MNWILMLSTLFLINTPPHASSVRVYPADAPEVLHSGRVTVSDTGHVAMGYSGTRIRFAFTGGSCMLRVRSVGSENWVEVWVDDLRVGKHLLSQDWQVLGVPRLSDRDSHTVELVKVTEGYEGKVEVAEILLDKSGSLLPWPLPETRRIEFIGDSITCGYGIEANDPNETWHPSTQNFCDSYASITARELSADYLVVARSGIGMLRNYDGAWSGDLENMPFLYDRAFFHHPEPCWDYTSFQPDVVCINLGTNDFSTTGVDAAAWERAYLDFVQRLLTQYPKSKVVCLLGPMLNSEETKAILNRVVKEASRGLPILQVSFFELSPQGSLGHGADWHPSKAQAQRNASELTTYLRDLMVWF